MPLMLPLTPPRASGKQVKGSVNIDGQHDQLIGKIQERYGIAREAAQKQVDEWKASVTRESDVEERRKVS